MSGRKIIHPFEIRKIKALERQAELIQRLAEIREHERKTVSQLDRIAGEIETLDGPLAEARGLR